MQMAEICMKIDFLVLTSSYFGNQRLILRKIWKPWLGLSKVESIFTAKCPVHVKGWIIPVLEMI